MAQVQPTSLTRYILTPEEEVSGYTLTTNNLLVLQNLLADASEGKLNLEFNAADPVKFAQDEAFLQGQIKIIRYLIDQNELSKESYLKLSMQTNSPE